MICPKCRAQNHWANTVCKEEHCRAKLERTVEHDCDEHGCRLPLFDGEQSEDVY